jgi:hypothetical protein
MYIQGTNDEDNGEKKLTDLAKAKLIEDAKRVSNLSKSLGISAAVKKPIGTDKSFLINVLHHVHGSNVSKDLKRLQKHRNKNK